MRHLRYAFLFSLLSSEPLLARSTLRPLPIEPPRLEAYAQKIQDLEKEIAQLHASHQQAGFSTAGFYEQIVNPLQAGQALNRAWLDEFEERYSVLHEKRYKEIGEKQHTLMVASHDYALTLTEHYAGKDSPLSTAKQKEVKRKFTKLDDTFTRWADHSDAIGEGVAQKDQARRMYAFAGYFKALRKMLQELGHAPKAQGIAPLEGSALSRQAHKLAFLTAAAYTSSGVLWHAYVHAGSQETPNSTPLYNGTLGINSAFRHLAIAQGYKVRVEGREHLDALPLNGEPGRKVVNLFLPAHRHDLKDVMAVAHLDLPHALVFANPSAFATYRYGAIKLPWMTIPAGELSFFAKAVAQEPALIPVGSIRGVADEAPRTMDQFFTALAQGISVNAVNYPQGFVANAGEILGLSNQVVRDLFWRIIEEGYELNLVPVSYETDSYFLSKSGDVDDHEIVVTIHQPLLHRAAKELISAQIAKMNEEGDVHKTRYVEHFFSTLWLEHITRHGELSWAELMERRFKEALGFSFSSSLTSSGVTNSGSTNPLPTEQEAA